jgi:hypothetical protein
MWSLAHLAHATRPKPMLRNVLSASVAIAAASVSPALPQSARSGVEMIGPPQRLVIPGQGQLYVEPDVAETNDGGDVLLAGAHNYLFTQDRDGRWHRLRQDSILGALVPRNGPARLVRSPVPTLSLGGVHAIARPGGRWDVFLSELPPYAGDDQPDSTARLWHGVYDGGHWTSWDTLPLPAGARVPPSSRTEPIAYGDTLVWAVKAITAAGRHDIAVFVQRASGWSMEIVPTLNAAYAALGRSRQGRLLLAVVQPDFSLPEDGNSLFLWERADGWTRIAKVFPSQWGKVHFPGLRRFGADNLLCWFAVDTSRGEGSITAYALRNPGAGAPGSITPVAAGALPQGSPPDPVATGGGLVWVLGVDTLESRVQLHFIRDGKDAQIAGSLAVPYITPFVAAASGDDSILVAGGIHDRAQDVVVTLLYRVRLPHGAGDREPHPEAQPGSRKPL